MGRQAFPAEDAHVMILVVVAFDKVLDDLLGSSDTHIKSDVHYSCFHALDSPLPDDPVRM